MVETERKHAVTKQKISREAVQMISKITRDRLFKINVPDFRKSWLECAKLTSLGISLHSFSAKTWDYPETLGSFLDRNPVQNRRIEKWAKSKDDGWPNILMGDYLAYILRPTAKQLKDMKCSRVRKSSHKSQSTDSRKKENKS